MGSERLKELFWCINELVSTDATDDTSPPSVHLDFLLQQKLQVIRTYIDTKQHLRALLEEAAPAIFIPPQCCYPYLYYLEHCLVFLTTLAELLKTYSEGTPSSGTPGAPQLPPNALSIAQQQSVQSLLQFAVGLGIQPYLIPGVGIPSEARFRGGKMQPLGASTACGSHRVLVMTVKTMLNCTQAVVLWDLVVHKHLVDLLAALLQLCHAPIKKVVADNAEGSESSSPFDLHSLMMKCREPDAHDGALVAEMHADRKALSTHLNRLVDGTYRPLLVRDLLLLMSCPALLGKHNAEAARVRKLPRWLKVTCGQILSRCLLKKDGLSKVILGVFDAWSMPGSEELSSEHDWVKCDAFARTVANIPATEGITAETYYQTISPQVVELLQKTATCAADRRLCRVARGIANAMLDARPRLASRSMLRTMFDPLLQCMVLEGAHPQLSREVPLDGDLCGCIELIHGLSCNAGPGWSLRDALVPLLPALYDVLVSTQDSVSYLRSPCEDILATTLASQDPSFAVSVLHWCVFQEGPLQQCGTVRPDVRFLLGDSGGIRACCRTSPLSENDWLTHVDNVCAGLQSVLGRADCKDVSIKFFLSLLKKLNATLRPSSPSAGKKSGGRSALLEAELRSAELRHNLLLLHLVQSLAEVVAEGLPQNREAVVDFVVETLERGIWLQEESEENSLFCQSVLFSLTILGVIVAEADMERETDLSLLQKCLPSLDVLAKHHNDPEIKRTARSLQVAIATHGVVGTTPSGAFASKTRNTYGPETKDVDRSRLRKIADIAAGYGLHISVDAYTGVSERPICEEAKAPKAGQEVDADVEDEGKAKPAKQRTAFEEVWRQLHDPLVPVRGHAFIELRNLVEQHDVETLKNRDRLVEACRAGVQEEDSYVYLTAIQALTSLADRDTDATLQVVVDEMASESLSVETRLNLGEVLLRTCKNLGEMAPKYRNLLVNCFLCASKHEDPLVRASGASNMGELCGKLGYSFIAITQEVLGCLRSLMTTDPHDTVRRAAILAVASLVKGMGAKLFKIIPDELKGLHRELKQAYSETSDEVACLQAQLAIEELNRVTREFLTPQPVLQKTIHILDFPQ